MTPEPRDLLDRSLKVLARHAAPALARLADLAVDPSQIRSIAFWILDWAGKVKGV